MAYTYNPACTCTWCRNGGTAPNSTASNGHSFGYANEHFPPSRSPWNREPRKD